MTEPENKEFKSASLAGSLIPKDATPETDVGYDPERDGSPEEGANIDANRALADHIAALLEMVTILTSVHEGSTTAIATVYLPNGFPLATETCSCPDINQFEDYKGRAIAAQRAMRKAENKLWELEGYRMMTMGGGLPPRVMEEE